MSIASAKQIVAALPPLTTVVALFVDPEPAWVKSVCDAVPVSLLQFHGSEPADFCEAFRRPYMKAVRVSVSEDVLIQAATHTLARGLLLDSADEQLAGGTGKTFDWSLVPRDLGAPIVLAGGLNADNVAEAVRVVEPAAVDVSTGVESAPGIKDPVKMASFINAARAAARGDS
ncbi:N-(5'phosphoribosyl)anthranilate isomerase [Luminiphilus syltensis NOR5-1B]|uniref:N-(5'-phosphoribosyl)anthranilate isomerase n=1 Tax=Luminiphilus syltensis NOR5-1B TaxID=565045 RepID=B8KYD5_9GAMM|nr:N-(5'phosphoribosyl)anthranilate isomerase [Luminiphilus syltensis NOR5-1B]